MTSTNIISAKAIVSHQGIFFESFCYTASYAIKNRWFELSLIRGSWEIEVEYESSDLSQLYYREYGSDMCITCYRIQSSFNLDRDELNAYHNLLQELKLKRKKRIRTPRLKY